MRKTVAEVNGYEIVFDSREDNTNIYPYSIRYGKKITDEYSFRTLKSAVKWAEKH